MFGAKFLCIFDTFFFIYKTINLIWMNLSVFYQIYQMLLLSFQEAKAKPNGSGCKTVGRFVFIFLTASIILLHEFGYIPTFALTIF